jgi:hypothetical protein
MKETLKEYAGLISLITGVMSAFLIFIKAQFHINIVPEFNDFFALLVLLGFVIWGIVSKRKKPSE